MSVTIFEVHCDPLNPDNFQTRLVEEADWDSYRQKIDEGKASYPSGLSLPRGSIPKNLIDGDKWVECDYFVPATGQQMYHKSWIVQIK